MVDAEVQRRPRLLVALLSLLLVVVAGMCLVLLLDRWDAADVEAERPADIGSDGWADADAGRAVVAAQTAATTYFTLDYRDLEADMDAVRALGTPEFVDDYDAGARTVAAQVTDGRLVVSAEVSAGGTATEYLVTDRAQVLVSVDVTRRAGRTSNVEPYRTRVDLILVDGDWKVAALDEDVS